MSMMQKTQAVVALVLMLLCSAGTFVVSNAGRLALGVFPVTVTLMWVYLISVLLLGAAVLVSSTFAVRVSTWLGFGYALMAFMGIFTPSLLDLPLQGGNLWMHLLVALTLLYTWLILPDQTAVRKPAHPA
ncbi:hypothetical protein GCM10008938_43590 [Deinococcus roseus]|uniref:DUF4383 domain-containing protein n=2 Tax=Deinococcus roseus TaxID=392414 RepID=A0ABQ2DFS9_9DEIO|nr:hypothetical protein GCM10008938_43590 [Deinococcus roseus]